MTSQVTLKALGLNVSPNQLNIEDGSLSVAKNVIIKRDNVIEPRRGYKLWAESFGSEWDRAKQLFVYKDKILRHYNSTIEFQNGHNNQQEVRFDPFSGNYSEVRDGVRIKSVEANSNFYFTTSDGIRKISAKTSEDLTSSSGFIQSSGVPKALDIEAFLDIKVGSSGGFLPADSAVAYRVVWGYRDLNENLLLGAPSESEEVYSLRLAFIQSDLNNVLSSLDKTASTKSSLIDQTNYLTTLGVNSTISFSDIRLNSIALTAKLDNDIKFTNICKVVSVVRASNITTITVSGTDLTELVSVSDLLIIDGFDASFNDFATVTSVTPTTLTYANPGANGSSTLIGTIKNNTTSEFIVLFSIDTVSSTGDIVTIKFQNNGVNVGDFMSISDIIYLDGFGTINSEDINGSHIITGFDNGLKTISFPVANTGTDTTTTLGTITSGKYRDIQIPSAPSLTPTPAQIKEVQDYILEIIDILKEEPNSVIPSVVKSEYIDVISITTASNVTLRITIPEEITSNYFFQVYRSRTVTASGETPLTELSPSDELQLVYEGFPTPTDINRGYVEFTDLTPDEFLGANLYTNANSGEGLLQSNNPPPLSLDIALFKGYTFFANTKTRHQLVLDMLSVQNVNGGAISSISSGDPSQITCVSNHNLVTGDSVFVQGTNSDVVNGIHKVTVISPTVFSIPVSGVNAGNTGSWSSSYLSVANTQKSNIYSFITARAESNTITAPIVADVIDGEYFEMFSADSLRKYAVFFDKSGTNTGPSLDGYTNIKVDLTNSTSSSDVIDSIMTALSLYVFDFFFQKTASNKIQITNVVAGFSQPTVFVDPLTQFTINRDVAGIGQELTNLTQTIFTVADSSQSLNDKAFSLYSPFNSKAYYVYFNVDGNANFPIVQGKQLVRVNISENATSSEVAEALRDALVEWTSDEFTFDLSGNSLQIKAIGFGDSDFAKNEIGLETGFTFQIDQLGILTVEKAVNSSPSISTDLTARNLINAINTNPSEIIYAYYTSAVDEVAGKMFFESRTLSINETPFYMSASGSVFGAVFNPDISQELIITSILKNLNTTIVTANNHGYKNGEKVLIVGSNCIPSIDGVHTVIGASTNDFLIEKAITTDGTSGFITLESNSEFSDNQVRPNRVYYSKYQQPEAVPQLNYIDIGAKDEEILRIMTLRDSLFVFKQDGLYRISGETAPFSTSLFDGSCVLLAHDSLAVLENTVYGWARSGIVQVTESGVSTISRPIDTVILPTSSSVYPGFANATFGLGYESDQSYTVYTVSRKIDDVATIAYRYHTITRTWTTYDMSKTCGIVSPVDDLVYLGEADVNLLSQERKNYDRTDYADRQHDSVFNYGMYSKPDKTLRLPSVENINVGDTLLQTQFVTIYEFNSLLQKLDLDPGPEFNNYYEQLHAIVGDNIGEKIRQLAVKLDLDSNIVFDEFEKYVEPLNATRDNSDIGIGDFVEIYSPNHGLISGREIIITDAVTYPSIDGNYVVEVIDSDIFKINAKVDEVSQTGTFNWNTLDASFADAKTCFNFVVNMLNIDAGTVFHNYAPNNSETLFETKVVNVNRVSKTLTLNVGMDLILGVVTIFNAIPTEFQYSPITMQDPLGWKHMREATVMFESRAFSMAKLSFSTDLLPALAEVNSEGYQRFSPIDSELMRMFLDVEFEGEGDGSFGQRPFGEGFFGGVTSSVPFRTYVPRQCQRCRFMVMNYKHNVSREKYAIFGITLTGHIGQSSKAYRS